MSKKWILIFKNELDKINGIEWLSAEGRLAAGEKNPINPINPVKKNKNRIHSIFCGSLCPNQQDIVS
jgi:hypothetical protein